MISTLATRGVDNYHIEKPLSTVEIIAERKVFVESPGSVKDNLGTLTHKSTASDPVLTGNDDVSAIVMYLLDLPTSMLSRSAPCLSLCNPIVFAAAPILEK